MGVEIWTTGAGIPGQGGRRAAQAEAAGYDGIVYVDSQNLAGDCYVTLALAAAATSRIRLGTGVTNPFTRHPAVTAGAIATIQAESGGRAVLGIGRGDSALAHLGYAPAPVPVFADYLRRLQAYLRGEEVPFDDRGDVDRLGLADRPSASRIAWLRPGRFEKVPVDVAATGPKVIRTAALLADQVTFALGADVKRLAWGIETARQAREAAGLDAAMPFGAYVSVVAHPDAEVARRAGEGGLSLFARFQVMHGRVAGPASEDTLAVYRAIHESYDMNRHSRAGSAQAQQLTPEFAAQFAILGAPALCRERLQELVSLGLSRLVIVGPSLGADRGAAEEAERCFLEEVLPALR